MAIELIRFLSAALILLVPGIWLARGLSLGQNFLERCATGCSLGLALAAIVGSIVGHFDLRAFAFVWAAVALLCFGVWLKGLRRKVAGGELATQIWMALVLLAVGLIQFAIALPRVLPAGFFDPRFHLILARQIQLTHHVIDRWPFVGIGLNYPTGSHVLIVLLSNISGLAVHTVFKDMIPLLGVLTTAQIYVLARRISGDSRLGLCSAGIYGLWAWDGSLDYFRWGGLPNQLAMLLFIAMLSEWPGAGFRAGRHAQIFVMAVCCAGVILVHHHVMVVTAIILAAMIGWRMARGEEWKSLAIAGLGAVIIDAFFLVKYVGRIRGFGSTGIFDSGEPGLPLASIPKTLGYVLTGFAVVGILLCVLKKTPRYGVVIVASSALVVMFVLGEYLIPVIVGQYRPMAGTFFTPSRFLADLNYFLPIFAASSLLCLQRRLRGAAILPFIVVLIGPLTDWANWRGMGNLFEPPRPFLAACQWIGEHTPPNAIVDDSDGWTRTWTTYLCWREGSVVPMPISEPLADYHGAAGRIANLLAGKPEPDLANREIVAIVSRDSYTGQPILWSDASGVLVVQEWPITTSSSSEVGMPARKLPGRAPGSGAASR